MSKPSGQLRFYLMGIEDSLHFLLVIRLNNSFQSPNGDYRAICTCPTHIHLSGHRDSLKISLNFSASVPLLPADCMKASHGDGSSID
jgi:hypothetical protein